MKPDTRIPLTKHGYRAPAPSQCPYHKLRAELPADIPPAIAALPRDSRGYPVPYFVQWIEGEPDFRIIDPAKLRACKVAGLCWVCGKPLPERYAFVIGPMCAINRTSQEPPSHLECANWSVRACPFLTKPQMKRREDELTEKYEGNVAGFGIKRNPAVSLIWEANHYELFQDGKGGELVHIGPPLAISYWKEGRPATRAEVMESITSGLPLLEEACQMEATPALREEAHRELKAKTNDVIVHLLPT
jgi:hypothetical protein